MANLNYDGMQEQFDEMTRKGPDFWKLEKKDHAYRVRFLPGWGSDTFRGFPRVEIWEHWIAGDVKKMVTCPGTPGIDRRCPICAKAKEWRNDPSDIKKELADDFRYRRRHLWNVLVRDEPEAGVQVFSAPAAINKQVYDWVLKGRNGQDPWVDFIDELRGYDVEVSKTGTGKMTRYAATALIHQRLQLGGNEEQTRELYEGAPDLYTYLKAPTDEELAQILRDFEGDPSVPFAERPLEEPVIAADSAAPAPPPAMAAPAPAVTSVPAAAVAPPPPGSAKAKLDAVRNQVKGR